MSADAARSRGGVQAEPLISVARRLHERSVRAVDLAKQALDSMSLQAYRTVDANQTIEMAELADAAFDAGVALGPLQGIPVSVKDLYGVPGFPTFAGSAKRLPNAFEEAGPLVNRLRRQLAVVMGKTHTVEFAFGGIGTNPHHSNPHNPWSEQGQPRAPGGSSAGAGVSLGEGSAWVALGTDTAGSVRIPAAWTGQVGLKTTKGRWSTKGIVPLSTTLDTAGVLARTVDDVAVAFRALDPSPRALPQARLQGLRIGRGSNVFFADCSPGIEDAIDRAIAQLVDAGAIATPFDLPEATGALALFDVGGPVAAELHYFLSTELPEWLEDLDPNVQSRIGDAGNMPTSEYLRRLATIARLSRSAASRLESVDVLITPTVANSPPRLSDIQTAEAYRRENLLALRNTAVVSYLGLCALTLPVGMDAQGMPVGLQLVARPRHEERLLAIAHCIEAELNFDETRSAPALAGSAP